MEDGKSLDLRPDYWERYSNLQRAKHELIRRYLGGWYAKFGYTSGAAIYVDTHAGRGTYDSGAPGSPVVALKTLLGHSHVERLLARCEFRFEFIELDPANADALRGAIAALGKLPDGVGCNETLSDLT